ncbi:hypothetical protein [Halobaculum lipolyticum]|uniref:Uncharacterized protein n=1 Tax=Halobaculum lipolyticum TaxID=3032001 RepID=A0ABD5W9A7_9EURY|nr:hypothetical protein [Halobaculum sp. DT31]
MVSRENRVIVACIAAAVVLLFGTAAVADRPAWVGGAIVIGVGVLLPLAINGYLDRAGE